MSTLHIHVEPQKNARRSFGLLIPAGSNVTPMTGSCIWVNRFGSELTSFLDHSGKMQDSTSNIWNELEGKTIMRRLELEGSKDSD